MGKIDYRKIYMHNQEEWKALTREPQRYEALLAGHYSDSNHFVYELLQNAEDAHATKAVIEYWGNQLIFYHDGKPFDEDDVKGVSSMLMGTKDKNDATTIGRFGMGFKSVFKYTYQPEIYSDGEAFRIENYLLPVEMPDAWDCSAEKEKLGYRTIEGKFYPFASSEHLTKFVIPFVKRKDDGSTYDVLGKEVLTKLEGLTGEILLFLTNIKTLYWIDKTTDRYAKIGLSEAGKDVNLVTCRIEGTAYEGKEEVSRYLKYKKVFDHSDMKNAEVSVAYKVNNRANNINEMPDTDIWVYFPTRDHANLPFLIHGSFETAVSREKLMAPSAFNDVLFDELGNLIVGSLEDLKQRKMVTQVFIRRILIPAFKEEERSHVIPGVREKITQKFLEGEYLPDMDGCCKSVTDLHLAVPFEIADFFGKRLFGDSFHGISGFAAFNNEREANFTEYFNWLINDLDIRTYTLDKWAASLSDTEEKTISSEEMEELRLFYRFLSDNIESLYGNNLSYTRSGPYERMHRNTLKSAWSRLKNAPLILNMDNVMVPAYREAKPNIYLSTNSKYKSMVSGAVVNMKIAGEFERLLADGFGIREFDNFQYLREKIVKKYVDIEGKIRFENSDCFEQEYAEDISQVLEYLEETRNTEEMRGILKKAYFIKICSDSPRALFCRPEYAYVDVSDEGIDLKVYYAPIPYEKENDEESGVTEYSYEKLDKHSIDTKFYERHGISLTKIKRVGIITTPVRDGQRKQDGVGDGHWTALGEYCPNIEFEGLEDNLVYISSHPYEELAKRKSAEILKLLLSCTGKLQGKVRYRKNIPYEQTEEAYFLTDVIRYYQWLYSKNGEMVSTVEISKYDLDTDIYGGLDPDKEKYEILGFIETAADSKANAFEMVEALDKRDKKILLKQLARELGMQVEAVDIHGKETEFSEELSFNPDEWISAAFPVHQIRDRESLIRHVREEFFCADPIKYERILRQIRVSKSLETVRSYSRGMYTNESNVCICQMCRKPAQFVDVTEIANYGIEISQFHLCLCRNCAGKYKSIRDSNKDAFKKQMKNVLRNADWEQDAEEYEIAVNQEVSVYFTQTHLAEIQIFLALIEEYGLPDESAG